jgi:hypothetical protein
VRRQAHACEETEFKPAYVGIMGVILGILEGHASMVSVLSVFNYKGISSKVICEYKNKAMTLPFIWGQHQVAFQMTANRILK